MLNSTVSFRITAHGLRKLDAVVTKLRNSGTASDPVNRSTVIWDAFNQLFDATFPELAKKREAAFAAAHTEFLKDNPNPKAQDFQAFAAKLEPIIEEIESAFLYELENPGTQLISMPADALDAAPDEATED